MPTKCHSPDCKISASFNYENESMFLYCKTHKLEGMINVKAKRTENVDRSIYFCEHKKQKSKCKICDGKSYCEHDKIKIKCVHCHGSQICEHNKIKNACTDCNGSQLCEHKHRKYDCLLCHGSGICEHNKRRTECIPCEGSQICEHKVIKKNCKICSKHHLYCIHEKRKAWCIDCEGSQICIHKKYKSRCIECKGKSICIHNKRKDICSICEPQKYLVNIQRKSIYRLFNKSETLQKTSHSIEYLGCSIEYFIEYIKSKMTPEMTFQNIHIDHIKPVSLFDLNNKEEFLKCCHYTNIQPLLSLDNIIKSNKWSQEDNDFWENNIYNKDYSEIYLPQL